MAASDWGTFLAGTALRGLGWLVLLATALVVLARTISLAQGTSPDEHLRSALLTRHLLDALAALLVGLLGLLLERTGAWIWRTRTSDAVGGFA